MAWFHADAIEFFRELELNNNREWFTANKDRYRKSVQAPMEEFAGEMIERYRAVDPGIALEPKKAVFRIYRDVRFSKDKTPYKTNAGLWTGSKAHTEGVTGLYFHIDARNMGVASGLYTLEPAPLRMVRTHIAQNLGEFGELLKDPVFVDAFGSIRGEANKIAPAEFKEIVSRQPLILNKQFYYWAEFEAEEALREDLADLVWSRFEAAQPMNEFLLGAFV